MKILTLTSLILLLAAAYCDNDSKLPTKGYVWMDKTDEGHYIIPVSIGTPPQKFNFLLESHTARTVVFSSSVANKLSQYTTTFKEKESSTFSWDTKFNLTFTDKILDVEYKGTRAIDTITIDGISIPNQRIILGTDLVTKKNLPPMIDGLIGFGFRQGLTPIKYNDYDSPIHKFLEKFNNEFTVFYNGHVEDGSKQAGKLTFGSKKDTENCATNWTYTNATNIRHKYWSFNFDGWKLGTGFTNWHQTLYLDTDNTKPTVHRDAYERMTKYWDLEKKEDGYYIQCRRIETLRPFIFIVNTPSQKMEFEASRFFKKVDDDNCILDVYPTDQRRVWYLTEDFQQDYCIHYDVKDRRIQFAKLKDWSE